MEDPEATEEIISERFTKRFKQIFRWFIGEMIDGLKINLMGGIPDSLKVIITFVKVKLESDFVSFATEDKLMEEILKVYNTYSEERKRDLDANGGEPPIDDTNYASLDFEKVDPDEPMLADEEEKKEYDDLGNEIEEEEGFGEVGDEGEEGEEEFKDFNEDQVEEVSPLPKEKTEYEFLIEEMENDAVLLEVEEIKSGPLSSAYNALDMFNGENITSRAPCTERKIQKQTPEEDLKKKLEKALKDAGLSSE